ncbi:ABC transporter permease [Mycolicibacterium gadium]|uniref:Gliding motility-associated ABC transporter permease subunit GldF n=1 Tax=Mycolicibacterium gadium TaxID=1794 RepID=A0A7I7WGC4_MYCGU|nr:ABC transporter permease subunit [Mycolicibacterium gadium]BBZ15897.1 gliding motility-associated ABC transporter permease subunit GldF [Mycolicibacterium gadium]
MRGIRAVARREFVALLTSVSPWSAATAFLLLTGLLFWIDARNFADFSVRAGADPLTRAALNATQAVVQPAIATLGVVAAFVLPLLTMRAVAEERRQGSLELLRALPVSDFALAAGKYLAALAVAALILAASLVQPAVLALAAPITWSQVAAGYLGAFLLFSALVSVGVTISALAPSQVVAASATLALFVGLVVADQAIHPGATGIARLIANLSPIARLDSFSRGLVELGSVAYYLAATLAGLTAAALALAADRRRG